MNPEPGGEKKTVFYHVSELSAHPGLVYTFEKYLEELTRGKVVAEEDSSIPADYAYPLGPGAGDVVLVELKTFTDFLASLADKRLFKQVHRMREESNYPPIIIVYGLGATKALIRRRYGEGWQPRWEAVKRQLYGFMAGYTLAPLKVYVAETAGDAAYLLASIAYHLYVKRHVKAVPVAASAKTPEEPLIAALSCIPGVSRQTARALLERFGSIKGIMEAPLDEIAIVRTEGGRRIPLRVAKTIKSFFEYDPRSGVPPWLPVDVGEEEEEKGGGGDGA